MSLENCSVSLLSNMLVTFSTNIHVVMVDFGETVFCVCRYRKQVEEMQRAFNKTIIKLQNTSRTAEEQVSRDHL